jgi:aryl-alcohol dehydrogenase-like predicted oxidoreductase
MVYAMYKGIGVLAYAPLMDGHLARAPGTRTQRSSILEGTPFEKKLKPSDEEIIKRVKGIAEKRGWTMSQVALAWSATKVTSTIIGVNSVIRFHGLYASVLTIPHRLSALSKIISLTKLSTTRKSNL